MATQYPEVGQIWSRTSRKYSKNGFSEIVRFLYKIERFHVKNVSQWVTVQNLTTGGIEDFEYQSFMAGILEYQPNETVIADFNDWMSS